MSDVISVINLHKIYKTGDIEVHALKGISLCIEKSEFITIMGSSGSGKSTFMNIIGCLDRPTRGEFYLDSMDVSDISRDELANIRNSKFGFVFQSFNLLPRTNAINNIELPLIYNGTKSSIRKELSYEALRLVGLEGRENHVPSQLSGGEQQRVAIARAIVNQPSIILADEPTGNLDSETSNEIMNIFRELNNQGKTVMMITHEHDIAQFGKRIVAFRDGLIISDEKTPNVKKH
ncbi:MAG: ABC transporter ATP-binding protein [Thermodesulfobacteriota bacterium]